MIMGNTTAGSLPSGTYKMIGGQTPQPSAGTPDSPIIWIINMLGRAFSNPFDVRLHPLADYPGPTNAVPFGDSHLVLTALGNECWNYNKGSNDLHVILASDGTCPHLGQQYVAFQRAGAGPWYQLNVGGGGCINVDESRWNYTGPGIIHLLPCSNGAPNDMWAVLKNLQPGNFQLRFVNKRSAGCLDLRSQDQQKNALVQQNFCNGLANQYWSLLF